MKSTLMYRDHTLLLLDQTLLPGEVRYLECDDVDSVIEAIRALRVRGAPAIGCAAAYGAAVAARRRALEFRDPDPFRTALADDLERLRAARPTAVNLMWAVDRALRVLRTRPNDPPSVVAAALLAEAHAILAEDEDANRKIGMHGAPLVPAGAGILTHCNAGALATGAYGTALGVIRAAHERGKPVHVWVDETRPLLQGARLTAWELEQLNVPYTLITDNMAAHFMAHGSIDLVVVGADRIAANGDTANKIGTYGVAVLAHAHGIPVYVAAPTSTIDLAAATGRDIPIEERASNEVRGFRGMQWAPAAAHVANPAFDVTPAHLIAGIITEAGVARTPYHTALRDAVEAVAVTEPAAQPASG